MIKNYTDSILERHPLLYKTHIEKNLQQIFYVMKKV